jgi:hypothetical protein
MHLPLNEQNPADQGGARRVLLVPCELYEVTLSGLRRQVLVDRHNVDAGMAALIGALAYGESRR